MMLSTRRKISKKLATTPFEQGWQFRIEIESIKNNGRVDVPQDFDIYVKNISHGATEITYDAFKVGAITFQQPTASEPVVLSMTMRDHWDNRIAKWFDSLASKVLNSDGTVNLPIDYLLDVTLYSLNPDTDEEIKINNWTLCPQKRDEKSQDQTSVTEFTESPMTFIQYRSLG